MITLKNEQLAGQKLGIGKDIVEVQADGSISIENDAETIEALLASGFTMDAEEKSKKLQGKQMKAEKPKAEEPKIEEPAEEPVAEEQKVEIEKEIKPETKKWSRN